MTLQTTKKKRVSKKLKSSWRKHVNINDVEEFLEDQRLDERLGPALSTVANDELFQLDTKPNKKLLLSAKERRSLRLAKPLKCFSALQPHTKVPDPIAKRNRVRSKEERKSLFVKQKDHIVKPKEVLAVKDRKITEEKREKNKHKRGDVVNIDIWAADKEIHAKTPAELNNVWVEKNTKKHNLKNTGIPQKNKCPIKEQKHVLSVEPPHPGMSYNPSLEDHTDLINIVVEKEKQIIKKEEHLTRVTRGMFQKVTEKNRDIAWLSEMSEGIIPTPQEAEAEPSDSEEHSLNPSVKNTKKTLKQRRKQKEQRALELAKRTKTIEKKKVTDLHQLKTINKQIDKSSKKLNILREKRKLRQAVKAKDTKRLAPTKYEEPDLDFNMGRDIAGNLRNLKKEGSLLTDRFKSLQKRNILEPSIKRTRRKAKVKIYTKPDHKEDWKDRVAISI